MAKRQLSTQQRRRIRALQQQRVERATKRAEHQVDKLTASGLGAEQPGRVVVNYGTVLIIESEDGTTHRCTARRNLGTIVCGDRVIWQAGGDGEGVVTARLPREGCLERPDPRGEPRPVAANLDRLVIVVAAAPDFSESMIDRYLIAAEQTGIPADLLLNKIDLFDDETRAAADARLAGYADIGYPLFHASTETAHGLDELRAELSGHTSLLVGQSGVGKSSLINALNPGRDIRVGALSAASGLGTHTTTATILYHLDDGGHLVDSPGVWEFAPQVSARDELERGFREFQPHLGSCRFSDCRHLVEPGCAIVAAVAAGDIAPRRLASYRALLETLVA